ncbi:hypothetical protein [Streptomyces sp. NPDC059491]|uniref:hypothetical protein n=1 Tax=Streptomyces sp. NPDC059491 TaxID=3346850 RepID=UPI0036A6DDB4
MTDRSTPSGPPPGPQWGRQEPVPARGRRAVLTHSLAALGGIVAGVLIGVVGARSDDGGGDSPSPASPTSAVATGTASATQGPSPARTPPQATSTVKVTAEEIPGDGTFLVGEEVRPGTYRSGGPTDPAAPDCYWARLKGTSGDVSEIIANGSGKGQATVTVLDADTAFQTSGCQVWKRIG